MKVLIYQFKRGYGTQFPHAIISHRDDGFELWDALHQYVEGVVNYTYPSDKVNPVAGLANFCCYNIIAAQITLTHMDTGI